MPREDGRADQQLIPERCADHAEAQDEGRDDQAALSAAFTHSSHFWKAAKAASAAAAMIFQAVVASCMVPLLPPFVATATTAG